MVGLDGEKMSKSKGNLVLVSKLRSEGVDPSAIRTVLLGQHYRSDWFWTDDLLQAGTERLARWRAAAGNSDEESAAALADKIRAALAEDLDAPAALAAVDAWAAASPSGSSQGKVPARTAVAKVLDALLGIVL
jgi:L-cysteine:1D-myo-inositol 2-amino-2-deoxy-alpha-D-glucopyranoside ligase